MRPRILIAVFAVFAVIGTGVLAATSTVVSKARCEFFDRADRDYVQCRGVNDAARVLDLSGGIAGGVVTLGIVALVRRRRIAAWTVAALVSLTLVAWYATMSFWAYTETLGPSAW